MIPRLGARARTKHKGLGRTSGRLAAAGTSLSFVNAEVEAAVARMATKPSNPHKEFLDRLFSRLKSGSVNATNNLSGLLVLVVAMKAGIGDQWINLVAGNYNPSVSAGAPTFSAAAGTYALNGTADTISTGLNPSTAGIPQNGWGFFFDLPVNQAYAAPFALNFDGTDGSILNPRLNTDDTSNFRINQAALSTGTGGPNGIGRWYVNRSGASATELYKNAIADTPGTPNQASVAHNNATFTIGVVNAVFQSVTVRGYAIWGASKSSNQIADFDAAISEYNTGFAGL